MEEPKQVAIDISQSPYFCNRKNTIFPGKMSAGKDIQGTILRKLFKNYPLHSLQITCKSLRLSEIYQFPPRKYFWLSFMLFSIVYLLVYSGLYTILLTRAIYDDALFIKLAGNIAQTGWFGPYNSLTLAKMPGFSFFLVFCMGSGIPYLTLIAMGNILAVAFSLKQAMWVFKQRMVLLFILGMIMLFNPMFAAQLNIYRNQFAAICFTIFIGVIIGMFNPEAKTGNRFIRIAEALIAFTGFGFLFYTRDESSLYYLLLGIAALCFIAVSRKIKTLKRNLFLPAAGIAGILFFGLFLSVMNYFVYERFTVCERTSAPFTKALHAFHSIDDPFLNPEYPKSSASKEKIMLVAEVIPEFKKVAEIICDPNNPAFKSASTYFDKKELKRKPTGNTDIPASHFEWLWINAVERAGFYENARKSATFHQMMRDKIHEAFHSGDLKKRNSLISFGPYSLDKKDLRTLFEVIPVNYSILIKTPKAFIDRFSNFSARPLKAGNDIHKAQSWSQLFQVKYILPHDKAGKLAAKNSLKNRFWNFWVRIFAWTLVPFMHLTTPLALAAMVVAFVKKKRAHATLLLFLTSGYLVHFLMLSAIEVSVAYEVVTLSYYLLSYTLIFINGILAIHVLIPEKNREEATPIILKE